MPSRKDFLDRVTITTPCSADWDSMRGNERVRFCEHCNLNVHNLSTLTRREAIRRVARSQGRICIRYAQRPDEGIATAGLPARLVNISRRASRVTAGAFGALLSITSAAAQSSRQTSAPNPPDVAAARSEPLLPDHDLKTILVGTVTDQQKALITGAAVTLTSNSRHTVWTATTDAEGTYNFASLDSGNYTLAIEANGFARTENEIVLPPGLAQRADRTLALPELRAEVTIIAPTENIQNMVNGGAMFVEPKEPLVLAALKDNLAAVKKLISGGVPANVRDEGTGTTALEHAVENGNQDMVRTLLWAGANVNESNPDGLILMSLRDKATAALVSDLIAAGAKINASDEDGNTPLMHAAEFCKPEVLRVLISNGAEVNARTKDGQTMLMFAATADDPHNIKLLLEAGADVQVRNSDGVTALMLAAGIESADNLKVLIAAGADINARDNDGRTALTIAVGYGPLATLKTLIEAGADAGAVDNKGQTALMIAASSGRVENVKLLIEVGVDLTMRDKEGKTALNLAREDGNDDVIRLLESRGAPE